MIPFFSSELPSYLANAADDGLLEINKGIIKTPSFPELCTTNEMFRVLRNGQYTILHCSEEPARLASSMNVVIMRANIHAKAFYLPMLTYNNNNAPDCYSYDGLTPSLAAKKKQANKCSLCPHNQLNLHTNEADETGTNIVCSDNARLAISTPDIMDPMLLSVSPPSLKSLREMLHKILIRKVPYIAVVVKISFDRTSVHNKMFFKPVGLLDDEGFNKVSSLFDSKIVCSILGIDEYVPEAIEQPLLPSTVDMNELDAILEARKITKNNKK